MHKRIKVLQCIRQGKIGGGESHLLSLMEHLDRLAFDPVVLSFTDGPMIDRLQQQRVPTEVIATERPFDVARWRRIRTWMHRHRFDVVHAHGTRAASNVLWAARSLGLPVVYSIHGWSFHNDQHPLVRSVRMLGERYLTAKSDVNISVSESNRQSGTASFGRFKSVVVNNGIDRRRFNPSAAYPDLRKELTIPADAVVVLFLARFTHQKQPLVLLKAFAEAVQQHPNLYLLMVGDGEQKPAAEHWLQGHPAAGRIQLLPFRADVPALLHMADLFVLPSLWEGLPIALLEAMAMHKAIIATKVDGTSEVITHGQNGCLINTGNLQEELVAAVVKLGRNAPLRRQLAHAAGTTITRHFDAATMTRSIENIYHQVVQKKGMV